MSPAFKTIEKNVFYDKQKMKAIKDMADEPSKAEEKALEYLQGTEGFDSYMDKVGAGPGSMKGLANNTTTVDMEEKGTQTKQQMQNNLKEKFGLNLGSVSQKMGGQIKRF